MLSHLRGTILKYYAFPNNSASTFLVNPTIPIRVTTSATSYNLVSTVNDPLAVLNASVFSELHSVTAIDVNYFFENYLREGDGAFQPFMSATLQWNAEAKYDFGLGSGRVEYNIVFQDTIIQASQPVLLVLLGFVILFSAISLFLTFKALLRHYVAFRIVREKLAGSPTLPWHNLSWKDKIAFFNIW